MDIQLGTAAHFCSPVVVTVDGESKEVPGHLSWCMQKPKSRTIKNKIEVSRVTLPLAHRSMCSPHYIYKIPGIHMAHSYNMSDVRVSYPHPAMRSTLHMDVTNVVVMKAETLRISLTKQSLLG